MTGDKFDPIKIRDWADILECESVDYEIGYEKLIASVLFELSTPEINGALTNERLDAIIFMLENLE